MALDADAQWKFRWIERSVRCRRGEIYAKDFSVTNTLKRKSCRQTLNTWTCFFRTNSVSVSLQPSLGLSLALYSVSRSFMKFLVCPDLEMDCRRMKVRVNKTLSVHWNIHTGTHTHCIAHAHHTHTYTFDRAMGDRQTAYISVWVCVYVKTKSGMYIRQVHNVLGFNSIEWFKWHEGIV